MPSFLSRIMPRSDDFGAMFVALAENSHQTSQVLVDLLEKNDDTPAYAQRIKDLEHAGDNMTHSLITRLNQTFITPFDREDIYLLASRIDDVLDLIDAAGSGMVTYRIDRVRAGVPDLAKVLHQATGQLVEAVRRVGKKGNKRTTSSTFSSKFTVWRTKATH